MSIRIRIRRQEQNNHEHHANGTQKVLNALKKTAGIQSVNVYIAATMLAVFCKMNEENYMMKKQFLILLILSPFLSFGQTFIALDSSIASALRTHPQFQLSQQEVEQQKTLKKGSFNIENPSVGVEAPYGKKFEIGIQQNFQNPLVYFQQSKVGKQNVYLAEKGLSLTKSQLITEVRTAYLNLQFAETKAKQLFYQDSIFNNLYIASEKRFNAGEADLLEKISAEAKSKEVHNLYIQARADLLNSQLQLQILTGVTAKDIVTNQVLEKSNANFSALLFGDTSVFKTNPFIQYYQQNILVNKQNLRLQKTKLLPGLSIGYLNQVGSEQPQNFRFRYGVTIPLWFWTYNSQIKAASYQYKMANSQYAIAQKNINSGYQQALADYKKYFESLNYYETTGLKQADAIISTAMRSFESGNISYIIYMQSLNQAFEIKLSYLETVKNYNQSIIQINYFNGQ
jgi:outer membrane protein TolC